jgi:hypothetical protein
MVSMANALHPKSFRQTDNIQVRAHIPSAISPRTFTFVRYEEILTNFIQEEQPKWLDLYNKYLSIQSNAHCIVEW